jgi:hypothetical protein
MAKSESRGKIHDWCRHGRIASARSVSQMAACQGRGVPRPRRTSCLGNSAELQSDSGTPLVDGNSQTSALISAFTEEERTRGRLERLRPTGFPDAARRTVCASDEPPGAGIEAACDLVVRPPSAASNTILARATCNAARCTPSLAATTLAVPGPSKRSPTGGLPQHDPRCPPSAEPPRRSRPLLPQPL